MKYVIDGHNLIHALPDIDLEDDNDEVKLVQKLRSFFGRVRKKAEVIFDHGLPGGVNRDLSNSQLKVTWASAHHSNADALIKQRIQRQRDPAQLIVVSSDHDVLNAAARRGVRSMTSQEFAQHLTTTMQQPAAGDDAAEKPEDADVEYWLRVFRQKKT